MAVHRVDYDLDRFLRDLFCHFGSTRAQKPRSARSRRIRTLGDADGAVEASERITHVG
jgi:hypothetical protein